MMYGRVLWLKNNLIAGVAAVYDRRKLKPSLVERALRCAPVKSFVPWAARRYCREEAQKVAKIPGSVPICNVEPAARNRRASAFVKTSTFAEPTVDRTVDRAPTLQQISTAKSCRALPTENYSGGDSAPRCPRRVQRRNGSP